MLTTPMDILTAFPVRKTKGQKAAFREAVGLYADKMGYPVTVEEGTLGVRNLVIGDPETAKFLVTAHYDTPARLPMPNLLTPCSLLPFLGYQALVALAVILLLLLIGFLGAMLKLPYGIPQVIGYLALLGIVSLMLVGPANPSNCNDNTSGVVTVLEIMRSLPEKQRSGVCFVLFDLEEAGLIGSASYRKRHKKASDHQLVLNLDCVGDGDHIRLFPTKKLKKDRPQCTSLYNACGYFGKKDILVHEKGFSYYPSDQKHFPYGVGICALRTSKAGLYLGRIHTPRDTILEKTNVNLLRAALTTLITCE